MNKKIIKRTTIIVLTFLMTIYCFNIQNYAYTQAEIEEGFYTIYTCIGENKVIDINNGAQYNGANAQIYEYNNSWAQKFKIIQDEKGYYEIVNKNSGKVLDIQNGTIYNGANVWQYARNNTDAQKWIIEENSDGTYTITSKLNDQYCLDVAGGENKNGANIQVYEKNGTTAQKFKLSKNLLKESEKVIENGTYKIVSVLDNTKVMDVAGGSTAEGSNIQLYVDNGTNAQKFEITYGSDGYYTIINKNSGKSISTEEKNQRPNGNIFQGNGVNTDAQKWIIEKNSDNTYTIFSKQSELCIDIANGTTNNGNNIWEYTPNGSTAQKFYLITDEMLESEQVLNDGEYNIKT